MQRIAITILLFCTMQVNAAFISASIGDSRIQVNNSIYKPGGIVHVAMESGFFNEPENLFDYKLTVGIERFGYSHSNGEGTVSLWEIFVKPMAWSVTFHKVMLEFSIFFGYLFAQDGFTDYNEEWLEDNSINHRLAVGYETRLGYQITDKFLVAATLNYRDLNSYKNPVCNCDTNDYLMGGLGINVQYNLPW